MSLCNSKFCEPYECLALIWVNLLVGRTLLNLYLKGKVSGISYPEKYIFRMRTLDSDVKGAAE